MPVLKPEPSGSARFGAGARWLSLGALLAVVAVNAAGLWAREVAALAGVRLPIVPMEHQYVLTNEIKAVADLPHEVAMTIDFEGESYLRQEGKGLLIGTYEQDCRHWGIPMTPADFGHELIAPDLDRMSDALEVAMQAFPCLRDGGNVVLVDGQPLVLGMTASRLALNAELFEKCAKAYVLAAASGGRVKPLPWIVRYVANGRLMKDEKRARERVAAGLLPEESKGY